MPAHPRSRGENARSVRHTIPPHGSSPLTRGKRASRSRAVPPHRLIPAHAGKTGTTTTKPITSGAHPRSRGENVSGAHVGPVLHGSSPLTRGKLSRRSAARPLCRLIPAHAGKTKPAPSTRAPVKAHPRSRGENDHRVRFREHDHGSSPLTRGKPPRATPVDDG